MHNLKLLALSVKALLDGNKTYITGAVMVLLGLLQGDMEIVGTGLGLIFLRNGIAKV